METSFARGGFTTRGMMYSRYDHFSLRNIVGATDDMSRHLGYQHKGGLAPSSVDCLLATCNAVKLSGYTKIIRVFISCLYKD